MLNIQLKQIQYNITKRLPEHKIEYIVVHYTANYSKGANAEVHYKYFNSTNRNASADFFVDSSQILQINDYTKYYTWQVGDGKGKYGVTNRNSIGIEMCVNSDGDFNKVLESTIELIKYLMKELNIDINHVVRHWDCSRKLCPLMFCGTPDKDKEWSNFKAKLITPEKSEQKGDEPDMWKKKIVQEAIDLGLITDKTWIDKADETASVWFVLAVIINVFKKLQK